MTLGVMTAVLLAATDGGAARPALTMREAYDALVQLQLAASSPSTLKDPKNATAVRAGLGRLATLSHAFPADPKAQEPATAALGTLFSSYAAETQRRFDAGESDAVTLRVRTLVGFCFTCHTRERAADGFVDAQKRLDAVPLQGLERAQVLAATRQFDAALAEYRKVLDAPLTAERGRLEFSRALQDTLAILVRVKDDAPATAVLLDALGTRDDLPLQVRERLSAWRAEVAAWKKEKFDAQQAPAPKLFAKAKSLVDTGAGAPTFAFDERREITWLRASGYLNLALAKNPKLEQRGEALYLLGFCAGALRSPLLWDVDLLFFEACVRENPKTKLARRCFQQLFDRVTLGYTGSGGTFIPDDELARLAELRGLAE